MKISISTASYKPGEDELVYSNAIGNITGTWSGVQGYILLEPNGSTNPTIDEYRDAVRSVKYINKSLLPTVGKRSITISLGDVDYLEATGHFYRFISKSLLKWSDAEAEAKSDAMMYHGLRGYLATITSQVENDFIKGKTPGVGWIGGSDQAVEGEWRWITGPEGLDESGKGRLFYVSGTGPYNGEYNNWNGNEPNNSGGNEKYAHITLFPTIPANSYKWNDLPNTGGNGDYVSAGYMIEFGGMPGEPVLNLSATLELQVNTMLFENTGTLIAICEGESITLNKVDLSSATYAWSPTESLSSVSVANPVANPISTTTYSVIGTRGICTGSAVYTVPVNPKPVSLLKAEENICKGDTLILDPGSHQRYFWGTGATTPTITVKTAGEYDVKLTSDKGCTGTYKTKILVHDYPEVVYNIQSLVCGDAKNTLVGISTNAVDYSLKSIDGRAIVNGLNVNVPDFGVYPMIYSAALYPSCPVKKSFDLSFFKIPEVGFSIDSTTCYHYNLDAAYIGDADLNIANFTWIFGGDTIDNGIGRNLEKIPLGVNQPKRDLVLKVEQNGCSDEHTIKDIRVIPTLSLSVKDTLLCQPDLFEFTAANTETGVTYDWDFGDGNTGNGINVTHKYAISGNYDIQLTVTTDKLCSNTIFMEDMVYAAPIPSVGFSLDSLLCLNKGNNEIFYLGSGDQSDSYRWDLSGFDIEEIIQNPDTTQGPFIFNLSNSPKTKIGLQVISKYGCKSDTGVITVKRIPDFTLAVTSNEGCTPLETKFQGVINDNIDQVAFTWDYGDGITGTGANTAHSYFVPDTKYNIGLSALSSITGCSDTIIKNDLIFAYPKPTAGFSLDNAIVYNDKPDVTFTDKSDGAIYYLWNFGDGTTNTDQNPTHRFVGMGHKKVLLEAFNEYSCSDTISHDVLVAFDRIFPPNAFSPNAPNMIDREFKLSSEGMNQEGYHLAILSRWNDIVFETKNEIKGWDGRMKNGDYAPAGNYVWVLNFVDFLGRKHRQTGSISLLY